MEDFLPSTNDDKSRNDNSSKSNSPKKRAKLPGKDDSLAQLAIAVAAIYQQKHYRIDDVLPEVLTEKAQSFFDATINTKKLIGKRNVYKSRLEAVNAAIDFGASNIKDAIRSKYGRRDAHAYFASYGLGKHSGTVKVSSNGEIRKTELSIMADSFAGTPFENHEYGMAYWQKMNDEYSEAYNEIQKIDNAKTYSTDDKRELRNYLRDALGAIYDTIRINFRNKDFKAELRQWGFDSRKY